MEGINRAVDFTFGSSRTQHPQLVVKSKKSIASGCSKGCFLFTNSLRQLSCPIVTARRTNYVVTAALKQTSQGTRRRSALRPKLLKVREPNLNISDDVVRERDLLSGENISQGSENKSMEGLEKQVSEGFREVLHQGSEDTGWLHALGEEKILPEENSSENFEKESTEGFRERPAAEERGKHGEVGRNIWDDLEKLKLQLDKDEEEWGVGTNRIFHIYENGDGEVQRVDVKEDAVLKRCGIRPLAFQFADEDAKSFANQRLDRARVVAKEIESGVFSPPRNSTVFKFVRPGKSRGEKLWKGLGYVVDRVDNVYGHVPGYLKFTVVGFAFLYCIWFFWVARKPARVISAFEEEERKKMLMRKMKSRMEKERMERRRTERDLREKDGGLMGGDSPSVYKGKPVRDGSDVYVGDPTTSEAEQRKRIFATRTSKGKVPVDDREFDRKIEMIRRMANEVRQMEQQKASKNANDTEETNDVVVRDQNGSAPVSGPIAVTVAKDENLNGKNSIVSRILDLKAFFNSNKEKPVNVADSNATDNNVALASAAGSELEASEKESSSVNALVSSATVVDSKGTETRISNGAATNEEMPGFGSVTDPRSKVDGRELGPWDDLESSATVMDCEGNANIITNGAAIKEEKLDFGSVADSGVKANRKALGPMDCKGTENGVSNGATRNEENLNLHSYMLTGESNGTEENKDFSCTEKPAEDRYTDSVKEYSNTDILVQSFSKGVSEKVGAEGTVDGEKPFSRSGTDKPKSLNGKNLSKHDDFPLQSRTRPQRMRPRVITSVEEAHALLASKRGKTSTDRSGGIEKRSTPNGSNGRIQAFDFGKQKPSSDHLMTPEIETSLQEELDTGGKLDKINFEKLRPAFKTVEVHQKENEGKSDSDGMNGDTSETNDLQIEHENECDEQENSRSREEADDFKWMQDDVLRRIVFKVKSNEEAGKEPFDGLDSKEEDLFFQGIEKTIERKGQMVSNWVADKVENLDYGKDGIAYDDPPEVFMARWKDHDKRGSSPFLHKFKEDREKIIKSKNKLYHSGNPETKSSSDSAKSTSIPMSSGSPSTNSMFGANDKRRTSVSDFSSGAKTIISSSGEPSEYIKDSKTESWQHTKKWSRALHERYNAEKDPEIKEVIKEMGQDLDRWITEDEVEKISLVLKKFSEEELNDMKRVKERIANENEKFGREAMLNKYRGYKPKKEDHLWWIDLPYVLCIELITQKDGELVRGFYSLEMAPDLEPRATYRHVIAFEDRGDAKNFCYILRSSLENANVRVIPRTSKDIYREAQSEGYKVTVIKKAQIQLYFDKPLQEVEDMMVDIGNDIYYDKILQEHVIDMDSVMENGFGY